MREHASENVDNDSHLGMYDDIFDFDATGALVILKQFSESARDRLVGPLCLHGSWFGGARQGRPQGQAIASWSQRATPGWLHRAHSPGVGVELVHSITTIHPTTDTLMCSVCIARGREEHASHAQHRPSPKIGKGMDRQCDNLQHPQWQHSKIHTHCCQERNS